jgi:hypothetical protein
MNDGAKAGGFVIICFAFWHFARRECGGLLF